MDIVDLLIMIIVVTILVTIVLGVMTYAAYKLRLARRPRAEGEGGAGSRFFIRHEPSTVSAGHRASSAEGAVAAGMDERSGGETPAPGTAHVA